MTFHHQKGCLQRWEAVLLDHEYNALHHYIFPIQKVVRTSTYDHHMILWRRGIRIRSSSLLGHQTEPGPSKQGVRARSWITSIIGLLEVVFTFSFPEHCAHSMSVHSVLLTFQISQLEEVSVENTSIQAGLSASRQQTHLFVCITDPILFHLPRYNSLKAYKYLANWRAETHLGITRTFAPSWQEACEKPSTELEFKHWASTSKPVQCHGVFPNWNASGRTFSTAHSRHAPGTLTLPYCIYTTSLNANKIPNCFAALQVSRQPSRLRYPLSTGTSTLCSMDLSCCATAEPPAQAKLTRSSAVKFLVHHYSSLLLKESARQHHVVFLPIGKRAVFLPLGLLLVRKKTCSLLHTKTMYSVHTEFPPNSSKYSFCTWTLLALLEEIQQYSH